MQNIIYILICLPMFLANGDLSTSAILYFVSPPVKEALLFESMEAVEEYVSKNKCEECWLYVASNPLKVEQEEVREKIDRVIGYKGKLSRIKARERKAQHGNIPEN